jgi:hypothetical protein
MLQEKKKNKAFNTAERLLARVLFPSVFSQLLLKTSDLANQKHQQSSFYWRGI